MTSEIASHIWFPEPKLAFHADRPEDVDIHPLRGLLRYGPLSAGLVPDPIRVATIAPAQEGRYLHGFLRELNATYKPRERREYLPDWPGFGAAFKMRMVAAHRDCLLELDSRLDSELADSSIPHVILAERLIRSIQRLEARRDAFDVIFIYLPQRWSKAFTDAIGEDFDLHDHIKAATAARRIPIQLVREDRALTYHDRASVMWRIGLALYAKAGGVPWKLAEVDHEAAYIGISYAVRPANSDRPRFVTCCSQVFDAEGTGLEFVAYDAHEVEVQRDNPFLSRSEMFRVMTRSTRSLSLPSRRKDAQTHHCS